MIIDSCANFAGYACMHPRFEQVVSFLSSNDLGSLLLGRHVIDGDNLFVSLSENDLKTKENAKLEAHDVYIDIQVVLAGAEAFGWKERVDCQCPREPYNPDKDIIFYTDAPDTYFTLQPEQFVIFFPGDAHAPLVQTPENERNRVLKAIFKVRV